MSLKNGKYSDWLSSLDLVLILFLDAFPASEAFDNISQVLMSSETERNNAIKSGNAIFGFKLQNKDGDVECWHIDLKEKGEVRKGLGDKPTDENFGKLVSGKANPQRLFMTGKLKVTGDVVKAAKMQPILQKAQSSVKAKL